MVDPDLAEEMMFEATEDVDDTMNDEAVDDSTTILYMSRR